MDENGDLIGTQYTLLDQNGNTFELSPMGELTGNCRPLELSGEIQKIAATYSETTDSVSAIRYMQKPEDGSNEGKMVTFGQLLNSDSVECNI